MSTQDPRPRYASIPGLGAVAPTRATSPAAASAARTRESKRCLMGAIRIAAAFRSRKRWRSTRRGLARTPRRRAARDPLDDHADGGRAVPADHPDEPALPPRDLGHREPDVGEGVGVR